MFLTLRYDTEKKAKKKLYVIALKKLSHMFLIYVHIFSKNSTREQFILKFKWNEK